MGVLLYHFCCICVTLCVQEGGQQEEDTSQIQYRVPKAAFRIKIRASAAINFVILRTKRKYIESFPRDRFLFLVVAEYVNLKCGAGPAVRQS